MKLNGYEVVFTESLPGLPAGFVETPPIILQDFDVRQYVLAQLEKDSAGGEFVVPPIDGDIIITPDYVDESLDAEAK